MTQRGFIKSDPGNDLRPEELAFLRRDARCARCPHLAVLHPRDFEDFRDCLIEDCPCPGYEAPEDIATRAATHLRISRFRLPGTG